MVEHSVVSKYNEWNEVKIRIATDTSKDVPFFSVRDIWWASVGQNIGVESCGKQSNFERPVLILRKFNNESFWGIPLTSQQRVGYYYLEVVHGKNKSYATVSQLRLFSSKRLIRKMGFVTYWQLRQIREK